MNIPFHLRRDAEPRAATDAFLLLGEHFEPLVSVHALLSGVAVFHVRGGFLLVPRDRTTTAVPGAIRLQRYGGDLFIPVDAALVPALLTDEIAGLTRERGLIVLPNRTILAFEPLAPLPAFRWLAPARIQADEWEPFPSSEERPEKLTLIQRPTPPAAVIEILTSGEPDDAERLPGAGESGSSEPREDSRPPTGSTLGRIAANAGMAAGSVLAWMGRMLAMPGLARAGANLARKAVDWVPRLTEKLFGQQEAALRDVLRELQEGDIEKALRRAPPAVAEPDKPVQVGTGSNLGWRDPRYSLRDLVGGGVQVGWLGGGDIWARLAEQYRRLAAEASARGDYRRAAYLYGMLLRDYRSAANALLTGGLFHDAAILFRDKVKDDLAAAAAFEKAAEYDEAIRLYDRLGRFEQAGDLLLRLEEVARARQYFIRAADALAAGGHYLAAGDLIRKKVGTRADANHYFQEGWDLDGAEAIPCAHRLLDDMLVEEVYPAAVALFDAAESRFAPPRGRDARAFFNHALSLSDDFLPVPLRDDLVDRTRLLFAAHLRYARESTGRADRLVSELFGRDRVWPAPLKRDAAFACGPLKRQAELPPMPLPIAAANGTVAAVAAAPDADCLVIATDTGATVWEPEGGRQQICSLNGADVLGLSVDSEGRVIYVLVRESGAVQLHCFVEGPGGYERKSQIDLGRSEEDDDWYLEPRVARSGQDYRVTVAGPNGREMIFGYHLRHSVPIGYLRIGMHTRLLACDKQEWFWDWDDRFIRCLARDGSVRGRWVPQWTPAVPAGSTLTVPPLYYLLPAPGVLEVAGLDADGILHWSRFEANEPAEPKGWSDPQGQRFRAACLPSPGSMLAATAANELVWIRTNMAKVKSPVGDLKSGTKAVAALVTLRVKRGLAVVYDDATVAFPPGPI